MNSIARKTNQNSNENIYIHLMFFTKIKQKNQELYSKIFLFISLRVSNLKWSKHELYG